MNLQAHKAFIIKLSSPLGLDCLTIHKNCPYMSLDLIGECFSYSRLFMLVLIWPLILLLWTTLHTALWLLCGLSPMFPQQIKANSSAKIINMCVTQQSLFPTLQPGEYSMHVALIRFK